MNDGLDVVTVRVEHEGAVVVRVVLLRPKPAALPNSMSSFTPSGESAFS